MTGTKHPEAEVMASAAGVVTIFLHLMCGFLKASMKQLGCHDNSPAGAQMKGYSVDSSLLKAAGHKGRV